MPELTDNDFIKRIEQEEYQAVSWDNKLFGLKSRIYLTKDLAKEHRLKKPFPVEKVFMPSKVNKVMLLVIAALLPSLLLYSMATTKGVKTYAYFIAIPVLTLVIFGIRSVLTSKNLNYSIKLTRESLQVGDSIYSWKNIQETFIVIRPKGRGTTNPFLLVGRNDGTLDRYDLTNLMGWNTDKELAAAIEYYRTNSA